MLEEREASFLIPVIDDDIYLCQRGTEPYQGYWCAIGGKADPKKSTLCSIWASPLKIEKPGGHKVSSIGERFREEAGMEPITETAVREGCEELFSNRSFPQDFSSSDFSELCSLGFIQDSVSIGGEPISTVNRFVIGKVNRRDFYLSKREVADFKPLRQIPLDANFVPITRIALAGLRVSLEYELPILSPSYDLSAILSQLKIPATDLSTIDRYRHTGIVGAVFAYSDASVPFE